LKKNKDSLLELARSTAKAAGSKPGVLSELYMTRTRTRSIAWSDGKLDMEQQSTKHGLTLRLLQNGRQGMASTQDFSPAAAQAVWAEALEALAFSQKDPDLVLPRPLTTKPLEFSDDPDLFQMTGNEVREILQNFESKIKARDPRLAKVIRAGFSEARQEWALLNSNGVAVGESSTESGFGLEVLAVENGRSEVAGRYQAKRFFRDLRPEPLIEKICEEALLSLEARSIPSGNYPTIFDPWVGCQFLELMAHSLCADQVQRGKSFFGRPEGQAVAAGTVTLVDDGLLAEGLNSSLYDDEGTPRTKTVPINSGRLEYLLYDATTAQRDKMKSTGNGGRGGFSRPPSPQPSNFYLLPSFTSPDTLFQNTEKGFLVQEVMGMHTADPISGDFSVGAQGRWIENGRPSHGVRGVTLAGNLKKMLQSIEAVANDLTWYGTIGTPTFRVSQLTVGGT